MARVQLENVKKIYSGNVTAVHDFNLDIADKEFVVFVGPSGCGKSTTLRMIAGLEDISEGVCKIDGEVVNDLQPKDRQISMVFQNYALYPHLTVFENMAFPLRLDKKIRIHPWTEEEIAAMDAKIAKLEADLKAQDEILPEDEDEKKKKDKIVAKLTEQLTKTKEARERGREVKGFTQDEIYERVTSAAKVLNITNFLTRKPKAMSGGQRQRVAIGRAMVKDCKVFLMDEPLSNLDAKLRNEMRAEIIRLRKRINTTFVYVTHDQTEAMTLGDRIVCMRDGFIMQVGTPTQLFDMPDNLFVAQFIGAPMMNTFNAKLVKSGASYYVDLFGRKIPVSGPKAAALVEKKVESEDVILGIRPEHLIVAKSASEGTVPVTIEVNEMMGSEYYLHVAAEDGTKIIVRIPTINLSDKEREDMIPGNKINLAFEPKAMHFFNPETEINLLAGPEAVNSKGPVVIPDIPRKEEPAEEAKDEAPVEEVKEDAKEAPVAEKPAEEKPAEAATSDKPVEGQ